MARKKKAAKKFVKNQENPSFSPRFNHNFFFILRRKLEKIPLRVLLALVIFLSLSLLLQKERDKTKEKVLGWQAEVRTTQEKAYAWKQLLAEKPDYRDGWLQLVGLYLELNSPQEAKEALFQAKTLDPNNEKILVLEKLLEAE
ncbi:MAG TPA: hypothetical protein VMW25_05350 [Clostridia bacterium]|nr:hypothetical protein [Clostridia bacterium]